LHVPQRQANVKSHSLPREQRVTLEHNSPVPFQAFHSRGFQRRYINERRILLFVIRDEHASLVGMIESDDLPQQRGLAVSRPCHDRNHLAATHFQVHAVEHATAAKRFVQILNLNLDTGRRHSPSIPRPRMTQQMKPIVYWFQFIALAAEEYIGAKYCGDCARGLD
jgi:hypothetical protein